MNQMKAYFIAFLLVITMQVGAIPKDTIDFKSYRADGANVLSIEICPPTPTPGRCAR